MTCTDITTLYSLVTEAIRKTEVLEDINAPGLRDAYLDVSLLEECIAGQLPASDDAGAIARRGAIAAAIDAHEFARARELAARFSSELDADEALKAELSELKSEAERAGVQGSAPSAWSPLEYGQYSRSESLHAVSDEELTALQNSLYTYPWHFFIALLSICLVNILELLVSINALWNGSRIAASFVVWLIFMAVPLVVIGVYSVLGVRRKSNLKALVERIRGRQSKPSSDGRQVGERAN